MVINFDLKKYCHLCGAEHIKIKTQPWICSGCGNKSYINSKPTAELVLFNSEKRILLAKRGIEPNLGKYDLPGGFVEYGESVESAISREINEELGLKTSDYSEPKFCMSWTADYKFSKETVNTLNSVFASKLNAAVITANDDVSETKFVSLDELDKIDFSYPLYPEIIKKAYDILFGKP